MKTTAFLAMSFCAVGLLAGCSSSQSAGGCGDGQIQTGEECDLQNLNGQTCVGLGFQQGALACSSDCAFDTSGCSMEKCGNGQIDDDEDCDPGDLGGLTCPDLGFGGGSLTCSSSCTLDASLCTGCQDDAREENDSLETAADLAPGSHQLSFCNLGGEEDWFSVSLAQDDTLVAVLQQDSAHMDLDLALLDQDRLLLASSGELPPHEQLAFTSPQAQAVFLQVYSYGGAPGACGYTLRLLKNPDCVTHQDCQAGQICHDFSCTVFVCSDDSPCPEGLVCDQGTCRECVSAADCPEEDAYLCQDHACVFDCGDDQFEPNSSAAEAAAIDLDDSYPGLSLCGEGAQDWFQADLSPLHRYRLDLTFLQAQGNIDVSVFGAGDLDIPVAVGVSVLDNESLILACGGGEGGSYLIQVMLEKGQLAQHYQLQLADQGAVECAWDDDCAAGQLCLDFACVTSGCVEDLDCTAPQRCVALSCVDPPPGDSCQQPIEVSSFPFQQDNVDMAPYRDQVSFAPETCTPWGTAGKDAVYRLSLAAGQQLWATASADFDVALVLASGCTASPAADACLAGADEGVSGETEVLYWAADEARTVYLLVDSFAPGAPESGSFDLTIEVE